MISQIGVTQHFQVETRKDIKPDAADGSTCLVVSTGEKWIRMDGMWEKDKRQ